MLEQSPKHFDIAVPGRHHESCETGIARGFDGRARFDQAPDNFPILFQCSRYQRRLRGCERRLHVNLGEETMFDDVISTRRRQR